MFKSRREGSLQYLRVSNCLTRSFLCDSHARNISHINESFAISKSFLYANFSAEGLRVNEHFNYNAKQHHLFSLSHRHVDDFVGQDTTKPFN